MNFKQTLLAGVMLGLGAGPASAIQIYSVDAAGTETLVSTTWTVYGGLGSVPGGTTATDLGGGTDWRINVGVPNFGSAETDSQTSGIYGAGTVLTGGAAGYRVKFTVDAYAWDSYNATVPTPNNDGYWDLFAVNMNPIAHYWDLVNGGTGALADPLVTPDPAGTSVISFAPLPGVTWGWGGLDYAGGFFEEEHSVYTIELLGLLTGQTIFVSATLDTGTSPDNDSSFPSWGCFNSTAALCPKPEGGTSQDIPAPGTLALLGLGLAGLALRRRRSS